VFCRVGICDDHVRLHLHQLLGPACQAEKRCPTFYSSTVVCCHCACLIHSFDSRLCEY
jgi:hypothetical protein